MISIYEKPKTVYEVVQSYIAAKQKYEDITKELKRLKNLRLLGDISEEEYKKRQSACMDKFIAME